MIPRPILLATGAWALAITLLSTVVIVQTQPGDPPAPLPITEPTATTDPAVAGGTGAAAPRPENVSYDWSGRVEMGSFASGQANWTTQQWNETGISISYEDSAAAVPQPVKGRVWFRIYSNDTIRHEHILSATPETFSIAFATAEADTWRFSIDPDGTSDFSWRVLVNVEYS